MLKPEKVAIPLIADTVAVPERVPPPGLVPIANVIESLDPVTVLPWLSCTVTTTEGLMLAPAVVSVGCVVIANFVAEAGVMLKLLLVSPLKPGLFTTSVYPDPDLSMLTPEKVATPLVAVMVVVPLRVPPPAFVPIANVIEAVELVTVLPKLSFTMTEMSGEIVVPATVLEGCTEKANVVADAGEILNDVLVADASDPLEATRVYPEPALLMLKFEKIAIPLEAFEVRVPDKVPLPGLVPIARVIGSEDDVTVLPKAS